MSDAPGEPVDNTALADTPSLVPAPEPAAAASPEPAPEGEAAPTTEEPAPAPKPSTPAWAQRRIAELTAQRHEAERAANEHAEARTRAEATLALERASRGEPPATDNPRSAAAPPAHTPEQFEARVQQVAAERLAEENYNARCNTVFEAGKKTHPDFEDSLKNMQMYGGAPRSMIEAALETDDPGEVLYKLGNDPDEFDRVRRMAPAQMGAHLAKMAITAKAPARVSEAPPPPAAPGSARSAPTGLADELSDDEWMRRRNAELKARRG